MRFTANSLPLPHWTLICLAAVVLATVALALVWAGGAPASAQDDTGKPARPGGLTVTTGENSLEVSVDWDDVDGADDYLVRWRLFGPGNRLNERVSATSSAKITVYGYGLWLVRVQACNDKGCSLPVARHFAVGLRPEPIAVSLPAPTPEPDTPFRPSVLEVSTTEGSLDVSLDWGNVDGADEYLLRWSLVDGSGGNPEGDTSLSGDSIKVQADSVTATVAGFGQWEFSLTACNDGGCGSPVVKTIEVKGVVPKQTGTDYDTDDDGLIDIDSPARLNAVRYDLDGNGTVAAGDQTKYSAAFPSPAASMGCGDTDGDNNPGPCTGYELTTSIDLNIAPYNASPWWNPIGEYTATFEGNGNTIANLTVDKTDTNELGLFSILGSAAVVRNLGLTGANVTMTLSSRSRRDAGVLAGENKGTVVAAYSTGTVTCAKPQGATGKCNFVGGLVGRSSGQIRRSHSTVNVSGADILSGGGLVGGNFDNGSIKASFASGNMSGGNSIGGLVGDQSHTTASITASYSRGEVSSPGTDVGGLVGKGALNTVTDSYYDSNTSGRSDTGKGVGKTTSELKTPTGYTGIYANWNLDFDGDNTGDNPWNFGTAQEYPMLRYIKGFVHRPAAPSPSLVTAEVYGTTLLLVYDQDLDQASAPAATDYTVKVGGSVVNLADTGPVAVKGKHVILTLASDVGVRSVVTVSYTRGTNPVRNPDGNAAFNLVDHSVNIVTDDPPSAPGLTARGSGTTINLSWTEPRNIELQGRTCPESWISAINSGAFICYFELQMQEDDYGWPTEYDYVSPTEYVARPTLAYLDMGDRELSYEALAPGSRYQFRVRAVTQQGSGSGVITRRGPWSNVGTVTIPRGPTAPDPGDPGVINPRVPANVTPVVGAEKSNGRYDVTISWDPVDGASGYRVEWESYVTGTWEAIPGGTNVRTTTDTHANLYPDAEYSYRVAIRYGGGAGPWSDTANVRTPGWTYPPDAPEGARVTSVSANGISAAWDASPRATPDRPPTEAYVWELCGSGTGVCDQGRTTGTSARVTTTQEGQLTFRVAAINARGEGDWASVPVHLTGTATPRLTISPTSLRLREGRTATYTARLSPAPGSPQTLNISRVGDIDFTYTCSDSDCMLDSDNNYSLTVTVSAGWDDDAISGVAALHHSANGVSGPSVRLQESDSNYPKPVIRGPTSITIRENEDRELGTYSARDPYTGEALEVYMRYVDPDANDTYRSGYGYIFDGFLDDILKFRAPPDYEAPWDSNGDNVYHLQVTAESRHRMKSVLDVTVTVTDVVDSPPAPAPSGLAATGQNRQVTLTWTDPEDSRITRYQYRHRAGSGQWSNWRDISGSGATTVSHAITGLANFTLYTIELRAVRGQTPGAASSVSATPTDGFGTPEGFSLTVPRAGEITLSWTDPGDSTVTYQYQQRVGTGSWTAWTNMPGAAGSFTIDSGLAEQTFYQYRLRAVRGARNSTPTEIWAGAYGRDSTATADKDTLAGTGNPDYILGLAGDDTLAGGAGDDTLNGGQGADFLRGGAGNDTADYSYSYGAGVVAALLNKDFNTGWAAGDTYASIENITGTSRGDVLHGDNSDNILIGGGGNDFLWGYTGSDTLYGGSNDDTLIPGPGRQSTDENGDIVIIGDYLDGGEGVDTVRYLGSPAFVIVDLSDGLPSQEGRIRMGDSTARKATP